MDSNSNQATASPQRKAVKKRAGNSRKCTEQLIKRKRKVSTSSDTTSSSISEDEWEEVDDDGTYPLEVTINSEKCGESKWTKFIRQQVNRKIRERQVNCHKMHLLCYIAHLRFWTNSLVQNDTLKSLCLSLIPEGYITAAQHVFDVATAERFLKWFRSAFRRTQMHYITRSCLHDSQMERLEELIGEQVFEDDKDLASLLFLCILSLKQCTRLCLSCQPVAQKLTMDMLRSVHTETFVKENINNNDDSAVWEKKLYEVTKKVSVKEGTSDCNVVKKPRGVKKKKVMRLNGRGGRAVDEVKSSSARKNHSERNYWVEYWDDSSARWICMDPWCGSVDMPESLEADAATPMHYVICIDNNLGIRDVTARYASKFLAAEVRRLRVDSLWWTNTLKIYRSKNRNRERMEDVAIHNELLSKPKPVTIAEFKNHPLYVLKKDILKYEAIYPENQAPIGQIRGIDIYPRSSVFHLDGALNWLKQARMVKDGEKPYKIVKGRVNHRAALEMREPRSLELYGYWQTEPYVPPEVIDRRVPRNEFGNLYVYKSSMVPKGCVHIRLDGITAVARQLDIDCVPAVVGWEFHKGGNHPILEGCVVLAEHEKALRDAWKEINKRKQIAAEKKRKERALKNWRRLVKGMLTMKKVRAKFLLADRRSMLIDERLESEETETPSADDIALAWPQTAFNLPRNDATDSHS